MGAQRQEEGGREGRRSPAAGSASRGGGRGRGSNWSGKFQARGRVSAAIASAALHTRPRSTAPRPPRLPPAKPVRAASPAALQRRRAECSATLVPLLGGKQGAEGSVVLCALNWPRRARSCRFSWVCGDPRCLAATGPCGAPGAHCSIGRAPRGAVRPSPLSPPSSASSPSPLPPQVPPSLVTGRCINPVPRRIPAPREILVLWPLGQEPTAAPLGLCVPAADRLPSRARLFPRGAPSHISHRSLPFDTRARMSEKRVEETPAELSAKEMKEKKEKHDEKTVHKDKKKEIVEDEENGAEEDEEENPDDVDEEEGGDEDEEGDENGQEQDGHAEKRSAEEEEDDVDPKRQKTENGSSA